MAKRLFLTTLVCMMAFAARAERTNLALTCPSVTASYTSAWNNLNSINNGTKGFGMDLPNEETWGCYISTAGNQAQQFLTYTWTRQCRIDEVSLYIWSDCQSGSGVAVPESWAILYLDENDEWKEVTLLDGEQYGVERFDVNTVKFSHVETKGLRLMLYAQQNDQYYSAMGVNEWEVYGEYIEEEQIDPNAKVNVAPYAESVEATYTSSWNNLNAINNGTKDTGNTLGNNETWGCWQGETANEAQQTLTYYWSEDYQTDSVSVYFWTDSESGQGVVVPQSWHIEYKDADGKMKAVTLLEGESYKNERYEPNHVKFEPVTTRQMNLVLDAMPNGEGKYSAIGVTEWEVFSADMSYATKLYGEYDKLVEDINHFIDDLIADNVDGLIGMLEDGKMVNEVDPDETDAMVVQNAINVLKDLLSSAQSAYTVSKQIRKELDRAVEMIEEGLYPGIDELAESYEEVETFASGGFGSPEQIQANYEKILKAIDDYRFSQIYSQDKPADYSFLGKSFQFIKEEAAPDINLETGEVVYPNIADYTEGSQPNDAQMTGWYLGETDGTQQVRFQQMRMCWYAEKNGSTELTINQNLKNLPNGYYAVSAEMITKSGCLTNQHVFAKNQATSVVSPSLSKEGWDDNGQGEWERLTTEKILVYDGTLTIGAAGTGDLSSTAGMFCATNFILYYYGIADESNIEELFASKVKECQEECNSMVYGADKATYQAVIDANKGATGYEQMQAALKALNAAQLVAQKSINTYQKFLVGPYKTLNDHIGEVASENIRSIEQAIVKLIDENNVSEKTSYKDAVGINELINMMMEQYEPLMAKAEATTTADEQVNATLKVAILKQVEFFEKATTFPTKEVISKKMEELQAAIRVAEVTNIMNSDATDYTTLIVNPQVDNSTATGWTINNENGDGNGVKSGQHFDGKAGYYFDSYQTNAGELKFTLRQVIDNVPNGTYELKAMARVNATPDAEGYYLYAVEDNDTEIFAPVRMRQHNYTKYDSTIHTEAGTDSLAYVADQYGTVWEDAVEKLNNSTGMDDILYNYYSDIYEANGDKGFGWHFVSLQVEVKNHELTIGVTTDSAMTSGKTDTEGNQCVPFSGTWFSADNFTLTLLKKGDNEGWSPTLKMKGDVNRDGNVDINDVVAIINIMAGSNPSTLDGDVNQDKEVNINDVVNVINIMAGK